MADLSEDLGFKDGLDLLIREVRERAAAVFAFKTELERESDRGCALVASAYLEGELTALLTSFFVALSNASHKQLFDFNGPLGTFSGKIRIAHASGLIADPVRSALELVRKIRNDFAHRQAPLDFNDPNVSKRVDALLPENGVRAATHREAFIAKVQAVFANLHLQIVNTRNRGSPDYEVINVGSSVEEYEIELAARRMMKITAPDITYEQAIDMARRIKQIGD